MSMKFLGKVTAGLVLGGASLLIGAPGIAMASSAGYDHHKKDSGWVYTDPKYAKDHHKVYIVEICKDKQKRPWVWSKVTGKLWLKPSMSHKKHHDDYKKDDYKKDHYKKDDYKKDDYKKDDYRKDHQKKHDHPWAYWTKLKVMDIKPGKYKLYGSCGEGKLIIAPHGWVHAGDGGAATGGNGTLVGGAGLLAASAIGGIALWRRRVADGTLR
jgi:hypothetical protein